MPAFLPQALIRKKRDGQRLSEDEVRAFIAGTTDGTIPDYQVSAMLMAIFFRGLDGGELTVWADAMLRSGDVLDLSSIDRPRVDKHSTGGVGDKISLPLAPAVAACGAAVPMVSGRGLGHTGGTLDKLESIPGFRTALSLEEMRAALSRVGCAMLGQTSQIAPADKKLYALRDVTGTVESIPLISASIMSKKIAEGIDALVLDVKTGSGAFMKTEADSRRLAEMLVSIGRASGVRTEAVITDMDSPLGLAVGNALEVIECLDVLKGGGPTDLVALCVDLSARMVLLGHAASDRDEAERKVRSVLASGEALDRFRRVIEEQGGDPRVVDDPSRLPSVPSRHVVAAERPGYLSRVDAELVGRASVMLGAGRDRVEDSVDPAVGIVLRARPGAQVSAGDAVLELHYRDQAKLDAALVLAGRAISIGDAPPAPRSIIVAEVR